MAADTTFAPPLDFRSELNGVLEASGQWGAALAEAAREAFQPGLGAWWLAALLIFAVGLVGERVACWKLGGLNQRLVHAEATGWSSVLGYAALRILFDIVGVLLFFGFAWATLYLSLDSSLPVYGTLESLLVAVFRFRLCLILIRAVLAPHSEGIRPLPIGTDDARTLFRGVMVFAGAYIALLFNFEAVLQRVEPMVLARATGVLVGIVLAVILIGFAFLNRARIEDLFSSRGPDAPPPSTLRAVFVQSWPYLFMVWIVMLWANWGFAVFTADAQREQSALLSWWITLLFPAADRLFHVLLTRMVRIRLVDDSRFEERRDRFVTIVQSCVRFILIGVALTAMAVNWNILGSDVVSSELGARVIWAAAEIGLILLAAYVAYEVVMSMLEKHIPEAEEGPGEIEGEGGGAGATREETLAPLLRGVFLVTLALVVALTVMSALGVQILPLIAGASIIGVAIGFGSQKLVQDVISGVFFLVDDAFRRGEYIDVGSVKGTVEKISVRSMQLRHHMGALHTIPFGEIRHLTNFSRDWVMMKLKLRLTYDTDPEKVRKLIKKLGERLLEHPDVGENFLQPLKSQGVYSMEDDSAMIVRVKFMTRPGDQFIIRKLVYAEIRSLFEREGIEFAHRVVSVRIDGKDPEELTPQEQRQVAGAVLSAQSSAGGQSEVR